MQIDQSLYCPICLQLCKNAVQSSCCSHLFCSKCLDDVITKFNECPCCKGKQSTFKESKAVRRIISSIKVECQHCKMKVDNGDLPVHVKKCPELGMKCVFCGAEVKRSQISKHTAVEHEGEARQALMQLHLDDRKVDRQQLKQQQKHVELTPEIMFEPKENRNERMAALGETGKYYCGGKLTGKCKCCDGNCGTTNGQNCDGCMELDVRRWNLAKGYLVNVTGHPCKIDYEKGMVFCGCVYAANIMQSGIFGSRIQAKSSRCLPSQGMCKPCQNMQNSLQVGRYKDLI